ncbi:APC family permease [Gammaproteobacteria bacterium]|nr:APC family permease [Gammaproteobacteria bacterium]
MELKRRFSPAVLLMLSINGMVGSAWLFAPLYAAKIAGSGAIIAWILGGFATVVIAFTFAEISALIPLAGGTAQIPNITHGSLTSFTLSWIAWLAAVTMPPIEVQAVLQYASTYFPFLICNSIDGVPVLTGYGYFWATLLMLTFCIINIVSFRGLVRFNFILFIFKISIIILVIFTFMSVSFHKENFYPLNLNLTGWKGILSAVATAGVAFAFTGFKHGVELAGEAKKPSVSIPLAIIGSVICCLILYLGLQIAFIGALSPLSIGNGWEHLSFTGDVGPFAGLAAGLGLVWLLRLLYIDATISPSGAGLIYVTSTARILYAMSKIGYLPSFLTKLNKEKFPVMAILVNFIIGMFLFLPLPGWQAMVSFLVSGMVLSYSIGPIAVLCLRKECSDFKRDFKLPFVNIFCILAFYFCNLMSYWTGWSTIWKLTIAIIIGFIVFGINYVTNKNTKSPLNFKAFIWIIPYLVGLILISYFGSFGGKNIITFGWDFLVIAIFSIFIIFLAVKTRISIDQSQLKFLLKNN